MAYKRGIELSLNFIVILIISIIMFGFGVRFIYQLSSRATELEVLAMSDIDEKISSVICEGSERICIAEDRKTIRRTKFTIFGIKITNIVNEKNFKVLVTTPVDGTDQFLGYDKNKQKIRANAEFTGLIINPKEREIMIEENDEKTIGIGVKVPPNAKSGTYILNVDITKISDGTNYVSTQKLYIDVP